MAGSILPMRVSTSQSPEIRFHGPNQSRHRRNGHRRHRRSAVAVGAWRSGCAARGAAVGRGIDCRARRRKAARPEFAQRRAFGRFAEDHAQSGNQSRGPFGRRPGAGTQIMLELLESGKDVVTANKALLAEHGPELFDRARALDLCIAFEAAVAGGIPIIANISQCLSANQIQSLRGILNGTSNFILTQMEEQGADYLTALSRSPATRLCRSRSDDGRRRHRCHAEAGHPRPSGIRRAGGLARHSAPRHRSLWTPPICGTPKNSATASSCWPWRNCRQAASSCTSRRRWSSSGTPLAEVRGAFNAIRVVGDAVGPLMFHGLGAGQMPTASAVVADMIDTVVGRARSRSARWNCGPTSRPPSCR